MAAPVPLDTDGYGGTYKVIGGAPALDFANLVSYRGTPRAHDWLVPSDNLARWLRAVGLDVAVPDDIGGLIELREALAAVFLAATVDSHEPDGVAFDVVASTAARARSRQRLTWDTDTHRARWCLPTPQLDDLLALDAARLLTDDVARDRLGACDDCRWLYLDTTRNHSRRWCDPADCGNRARQRRHYHRQR